MVSWMGFPENRFQAGELHAEGWLVSIPVRQSRREVRIGQHEKLTLNTVAAEALAHSTRCSGAALALQSCLKSERGESDFCILKSADRSPWDTLWEGGITLARAVSCSQGQSSVRNAAGSCQKLLPQPPRRRAECWLWTEDWGRASKEPPYMVSQKSQ